MTAFVKCKKGNNAFAIISLRAPSDEVAVRLVSSFLRSGCTCASTSFADALNFGSHHSYIYVVGALTFEVATVYFITPSDYFKKGFISHFERVISY